MAQIKRTANAVWHGTGKDGGRERVHRQDEGREQATMEHS